jgi:inositol phosphorylceramide mannosyltransferase catalytic subunit
VLVVLLTQPQLWTDKSAREFIASEYPWFLETFDGYQFPIQRADAIRYFVLAYYGGIYIDLDDVCLIFFSVIFMR